MPPPDPPPGKSTTVPGFKPANLDSTVIAVPLLNAMKPELELLARVEREFPDLLKQFNTGLELNPAYPGGLAAALARAREFATQAAEDGRRALPARLRDLPPGLKSVEEQRQSDLTSAIAQQAIKDPQTGSQYAFANLHAGIVRRILALNSASKPDPILRILPTRFQIIIDLNLDHLLGRNSAREWVLNHVPIAKQQVGVNDSGQEVFFVKSAQSNQYLFARLEARVIQKLVELDLDQAKAKAEIAAVEAAKIASAPPAKPAVGKCATPSNLGAVGRKKYRAIYHIWPDFEVSASTTKSIATVKADAAQSSFSARGKGVTWAVMDSGIEAGHVHFSKHKNLDVNPSWHKDFTADGTGPLTDENGHGTHVGGIIAGETSAQADGLLEPEWPIAVSRSLKKDQEDIEYHPAPLSAIRGMAPECKLVSLKVLDQDGKGFASSIIAAIDHVQEINGHGRRLLIQGVNLSLGYPFDPEWFACGQSPLCVEVDRLVKSGVVVVVAAGNTGYGTLKSNVGATAAGLALTINDPGNADLAITVGSTHRDMPHVYGVSYFSSKGPTGDGRLKPDLLAPGEKIISCATGKLKAEGAGNLPCQYVESSGTSMAAPHVSGVVAAFLSIRSEFVGHAERVKEIFVSNATDLRRDRYFQGAGLIDLMRAIQSV